MTATLSDPWRPVADGLPPEGLIVLVRSEFRERGLPRVVVTSARRCRVGGWLGLGPAAAENVTGWMPVPEPAEGGAR